MTRREPFPFRNAAFLLGAALLAGYAVVALMTARDTANRPQLETLRSETAAGVPVVLPEPWPPDPTRPVLTREGVPLYIREPDEDLRREDDWKMIRSGTDESGRIPLYRLLSKGELSERLFLKAAPGSYYDLSPKPGKPPEPTGPAKPAETPKPPLPPLPSAPEGD